MAYVEEEATQKVDYPLHTSWTFWVDKTVRGATASEHLASLKRIYTVKTVHEFWQVYNNIPSVDKIASGFSYHLMRGCRRPLWEDEENSDGGTWKLRILCQKTERTWKEVLMACIGEQMDDALSSEDLIIGASVGRRGQEDIIKLWNIDAALADKRKMLGKLSTLLPGVVVYPFLVYGPHKSSISFDRQIQTGRKRDH